MKKSRKTLIGLLLCGLLLSGCNAYTMPSLPEPSEITTSIDETIETDDASDEASAQLEAYRSAMDLIDAGEYHSAYDILLTIKGYKDVDKYLERFSFQYDYQITRYQNVDNIQIYYIEHNQYGKTTYYKFYSPGYGYEYFYEYDENQNLLEYVNKDSYGESTEKYQYDEQGRVIYAENSWGESLTIQYDKYGNRKMTSDSGKVRIDQYDDNGNCISYQEFDYEGNKIWETKNTYDENGNILLNANKYWIDGVEGSNSVIYEYDENGYLIKKYHNSQYHSYYYVYKYDEDGNMRNDMEYSADGTLLCYRLSTYDEYGNLIKYVVGDERGDYKIETYEYDCLGNCIEKHVKSPIAAFMNYSITYEYDEYGNKIKTTGFNDIDGDYVIDYIIDFEGYKLYYNPYEVKELDIPIGK